MVFNAWRAFFSGREWIARGQGVALARKIDVKIGRKDWT
jgi:hypothetical protein